MALAREKKTVLIGSLMGVNDAEKRQKGTGMWQATMSNSQQGAGSRESAKEWRHRLRAVVIL